jgi:hypothetical protein
MKYNIELEKEAINLGFKKKWFDDKSGYWLEKNVKFKHFKLKFVIESDYKLFLMSCQTYELHCGYKLYKREFEEIAKFKCDINTIKEILKEYK